MDRYTAELLARKPGLKPRAVLYQGGVFLIDDRAIGKYRLRFFLRATNETTSEITVDMNGAHVTATDSRTGEKIQLFPCAGGGKKTPRVGDLLIFTPYLDGAWKETERYAIQSDFTLK